MSNKLFGQNSYHTKTVLIGKAVLTGELRIHSDSFYKQRGKRGREFYSEWEYLRLKRNICKELIEIPYGGAYNRLNSNRKYFKILHK